MTYKVKQERIEVVDFVEQLTLLRGDVSPLDKRRGLHHEIDAGHRIIAAEYYRGLAQTKTVLRTEAGMQLRTIEHRS